MAKNNLGALIHKMSQDDSLTPEMRSQIWNRALDTDERTAEMPPQQREQMLMKLSEAITQHHGIDLEQGLERFGVQGALAQGVLDATPTPVKALGSSLARGALSHVAGGGLEGGAVLLDQLNKVNKVMRGGDPEAMGEFVTGPMRQSADFIQEMGDQFPSYYEQPSGDTLIGFLKSAVQNPGGTMEMLGETAPLMGTVMATGGAYGAPAAAALSGTLGIGDVADRMREAGELDENVATGLGVIYGMLEFIPMHQAARAFKASGAASKAMTKFARAAAIPVEELLAEGEQERLTIIGERLAQNPELLQDKNFLESIGEMWHIGTNLDEDEKRRVANAQHAGALVGGLMGGVAGVGGAVKQKVTLDPGEAFRESVAAMKEKMPEATTQEVLDAMRVERAPAQSLGMRDMTRTEEQMIEDRAAEAAKAGIPEDHVLGWATGEISSEEVAKLTGNQEHMETLEQITEATKQATLGEAVESESENLRLVRTALTQDAMKLKGDEREVALAIAEDVVEVSPSEQLSLVKKGLNALTGAPDIFFYNTKTQNEKLLPAAGMMLPNGAIGLHASTSKPGMIAAVALHEITHLVEKNAPKVFAELKRIVQEVDPQMWAASERKVAELYGDVTDSEVVANVMGDPQIARLVWNALADINTTKKLAQAPTGMKMLYERFQTWLLKKAKKSEFFRKEFGLDKVPLKRDVREAARIASMLAEQYQTAKPILEGTAQTAQDKKVKADSSPTVAPEQSEQAPAMPMEAEEKIAPPKKHKFDKVTDTRIGGTSKYGNKWVANKTKEGWALTLNGEEFGTYETKAEAKAVAIYKDPESFPAKKIQKPKKAQKTKRVGGTETIDGDNYKLEKTEKGHRGWKVTIGDEVVAEGLTKRAAVAMAQGQAQPLKEPDPPPPKKNRRKIKVDDIEAIGEQIDIPFSRVSLTPTTGIMPRDLPDGSKVYSRSYNIMDNQSLEYLGHVLVSYIVGEQDLHVDVIQQEGVPFGEAPVASTFTLKTARQLIRKWPMAETVSGLAIAGKRGDAGGVEIKKKVPKQSLRDALREAAKQGFDEDTLIKMARNGEIISNEDLAPMSALRDTAPGWHVPEETRWFQFRKAIYDRFLPIVLTQNSIMEDLQVPVLDESVDVVLAQEQYHGIVKNEINKVEKAYIEDLRKWLRKNADDVPLDVFEEFLLALHAGERNKFLKEIWIDKRKKRLEVEIKEIDKKLLDADVPAIYKTMRTSKLAELNDLKLQEKTGKYRFSGMKTDEASKIIKDRKKDTELWAKLQEGRKLYRRMIDHKIDILIDGGLMTKKQAKGVMRYENYVPLKQNSREDLGDFEDILVDTGIYAGRGFDVRGQEIKSSFGVKHEKPYGNIVARSILDIHEAVVRVEKNKVGLALLKLVEENPNKAVWEIDKEFYRKVIDKRTGEAREVVDVLKNMDENVFAVKRDGIQHYVTLHDTRMANALKNYGAHNQNAVVNMFRMVNKYLAAMNTAMNPEFVISNFLKDTQTAMYNIGAMGDKDMDAKRILMDSVAAARGMWLAEKGSESDNEWKKVAEEFIEHGGKIEFFGLNSLEDLQKELSGDLKRGMTLTRAIQLKNWMFDINAAVENGTRIAAYKMAKEAGLSKKRAANLARNLTVNFNKRGEADILNALYLFFNASVQGTARFAQALTSPRGVKLMSYLTLAMFGVATWNRYGGGEDPEDGVPYTDKVPDFIKERSLTIQLGGGHRITIPAGYGPGTLAIAAANFMDRMIAESMRSDWNPKYMAKTLTKETGTFINAFISMFNPFGETRFVGGSAWGRMRPFIPSFGQPIVDTMVNKTYYDTPIRPGDAPFDNRPEHMKVFSRVSWASQELMRSINKVAGGDDDITAQGSPLSWVMFNPENIDHVAKSFAGAATQTFLMRPVNLLHQLYKYANDEKVDIEHNDWPFWRRIVGEDNDISVPGMYYDNLKYIEQVENSFKRREEKEGWRPGEKESWGKRFGWMVPLFEPAAEWENTRKEIKKMDATEEEIFSHMKSFNKMFREAEEKGFKE